MDLLILRRRHPDEPARATSWETTRLVDVDGLQVRINSYLAEHPQLVLGELAVGQGMYGADTLHVHPRGTLEDTPAQLTEALGELVEIAREQGLVWDPRNASRSPAATGDPSQTAQLAPEGVWDGHITAEPDGAFTVTSDGLAEPLKVPASHRSELRALLALRDTARSLLAAEASTLEDTAELAELRSQLGGRYRDYQRRYGPINRFTLRRTGRTDSNSGEERMARVTPTAVRLLRSDPFAPLVQALENFDETTQAATPAGILTGRVVVPRAPRHGADTPQDALAICLDTRGRADLGEIAHLLGVTAAEARGQLGELVYEDPAEQRLVPAAEYLSGNVRAKLEHARHAAIERPELEVNVRALERVLPADLTVEEIEPRLGAVWIDADTHRQFLSEILEDPDIQVEHPGGAMWAVKGRQLERAGHQRVGNRAGCPPPPWRRPCSSSARSRSPTRPTTAAASSTRPRPPPPKRKPRRLQERFSEWCWEDPDRARLLAGEYNRRFNAIVLRDYSTEGERLTLPGLARTFTPRPHQRAAVARMLAEPAVGLFHQVGAGKTAEMVIGAMELRRLGLVSKPAVVVPNHMLEQFSREWLQLYPQARVLAASSDDLAGERRRTFVARTAANDWDAVILTRSAFARLPVSAETKIAYTRRELAQLRAMLEHSKGAGGLTVKRLEKQILREEERLQALLDSPRDPGVELEQTGIDYLIIDEAHDYKNLQTVSNIRDAAIDGSQRASDLHMKLAMAPRPPRRPSRDDGHRDPDREQHHRSARDDPLPAPRPPAGRRDRGLRRLGGDVRADRDRDRSSPDRRRGLPDAHPLRPLPERPRNAPALARVRRRQNRRGPPATCTRAGRTRRWAAGARDGADRPQPRAPVLRARARAAAPTPSAAGWSRRKRTTCSRSPPTAAKPRSTLGSSPGRRPRHPASSTTPPTPSPASGTTTATRSTAPRPATPRRSPAPCRSSSATSPHPTRIDGTPTTSCASCSPPAASRPDRSGSSTRRATTPRRPACSPPAAPATSRCWSARRKRWGWAPTSRTGASLSTTSTAPGDPADIEQRDGRGVRQGNQNPEIHIIRYATQGSFDTYSWQTVERKARFINQVMRGRLDVRDIEDIGENTLSFAEVKALASGDPLILDKAKIDAEVTRLHRLERAWQRAQHTLKGTIAGAEDRATALAEQIAAVRAAAAQRTDTRGDLFRMTVNGRAVTARTDAAQLLACRLQQLPYGQRVPIGELAGLPVDAEITAGTNGRPIVQLTLHGLPAAPATLERAQLADSGLSLVRQLEHRAATLPELADRLHADRDAALREHATAREQLARPFKYADELTDARDRQQQIHEQISTRHAQNQQPEPTSGAAPADPVLATRAAAFPSAPSSRPPTAMPAADRSHLPSRPPARGPARGR